MKIEFIVRQHSELNDELLDKIICLKQQHWNYSYESQKKWIKDSLKPQDIHLLMKCDDVYVAYLSINIINMVVDGQSLIAKGLGNVCVDKAYQGKGLGKIIVEKANEIIKQNNDIGILLCHNHLINFYEKCGWVNIQYGNLTINQEAFFDVMMLFNCEFKQISYMLLDRNF